MHTSFELAPAKGAKRARLRAKEFKRQLRRYPAEVRFYVARAARMHPAVADLVIAFPALVIAIAMPTRGFDHWHIVSRVIAGDPLDVLARQARVPMWLRKLPPEAFTRSLEPVPDGEMFARRIGNHSPKHPRDAAEWLRIVTFAAQAVHEPFALWIAKSLGGKGKQLRRLQLVALWAWHSQRPDTTAGALIRRRWTPAMRYDHARGAAQDWLENIALHVAFADAGALEPWLKPGIFDGFHFMPVLTAAELMAEAADMRHCVRTYGEGIVEQSHQIWSVRRDGKRVATIEVSACQDQLLLGVGQLRGRQNKGVAIPVAVAVRNWLNAHALEELHKKPSSPQLILPRRRAWQSLWKPYWLAKRKFPEWLPVMPLDDISDLGGWD
jgi:hypothetical protein